MTWEVGPCAALRSLASLALAGAIGCTPASDADPGPLVREALGVSNQLERAARLAPLLQGLQPNQLESVVLAYEAGFGTGAERGMPLVLLMEAWAAVDPEQAFERVSSWPMEIRVGALGALLRPWARRDPAAARRTFDGLARKQLHEQAKTGLLVGWAESGDRGVWDFVAALEPGIPREAASRHVMETLLIREGQEALLLEVAALPDDAVGQFKNAALRTAAELVAGVDPERAIAFAAQYEGSRAHTSMLARIAQKWAQYDGQAALEWTLSLEPGLERDRAMRDAFHRWRSRDEAAALAWVEARPGSADISALYGVYTRAIASHSPERALDWAAQIPDPELRRRTLLEVGGTWFAREPEVASGRLAELGIYDAVREAEAKRPVQRGPVGGQHLDRFRRLFGGPAGKGAGTAEGGVP